MSLPPGIRAAAMLTAYAVAARYPGQFEPIDAADHRAAVDAAAAVVAWVEQILADAS